MTIVDVTLAWQVIIKQLASRLKSRNRVKVFSVKNYVSRFNESCGAQPECWKENQD